MKNCTWCGKEYPDDAVICVLDGRKLYPPDPPAPLTPEAIEATKNSALSKKYSTFWPRFCAAFIDGLALLPLSFANVTVYWIYRDLWRGAPLAATMLLILWSVFFYSAHWLYSVLLHAYCGQTLGKMAMNIQVLDVSEERIPTLLQAFLRDIGYITINLLSLGIYTFHLCQLLVGIHLYSPRLFYTARMTLGYAGLGWFLVEAISMLTNKKRRAVHDFIAGTVVVRKVKAGQTQVTG